jgi:hypothetical protein
MAQEEERHVSIAKDERKRATLAAGRAETAESEAAAARARVGEIAESLAATEAELARARESARAAEAKRDNLRTELASAASTTASTDTTVKQWLGVFVFLIVNFLSSLISFGHPPLN